MCSGALSLMVPENTFIHKTKRTIASVGMMVLRFWVSQFNFLVLKASVPIYLETRVLIQSSTIFGIRLMLTLSLTSTMFAHSESVALTDPLGQAIVWASLNSMTYLTICVLGSCSDLYIYIKPISSGIDITIANYNTTQSTQNIYCWVSKIKVLKYFMHSLVR